jgi:hypothetical protein
VRLSALQGPRIRLTYSLLQSEHLLFFVRYLLFVHNLYVLRMTALIISMFVHFPSIRLPYLFDSTLHVLDVHCSVLVLFCLLTYLPYVEAFWAEVLCFAVLYCTVPIAFYLVL